MKTRVKSSLIMAPLLLIVFLGGYFLLAGAIFFTILAIREYCSAFGEKRPAEWVLWASLCILYGGSFIEQLQPFAILAIWLFISIVLCFISMFSMEKRDLMQGMATIMGVVYIIFLLSHIVLIDKMFTEQYLYIGNFRISGLASYVWIVFLAAFGTDIFAFFTGKLFGRHKLIPSVSPKKTVEGSIGGIIGSVVLCGLFGYFFLDKEFLTCIIIGILGGVVSQLGDLSASVIKRKIGIKDWGTLIPGHGGILDRIDSVLFTAPLVFYILIIKQFWAGAGL